MKALIFLSISLLLTVELSAQKSPIKFGEIPMEDMTMTVYSQDSSAAAVILTDYGESYLYVTDVNASLMFERHTRIKILSKEGVDWANVIIPVYNDGPNEERVSTVRGATYNLENGVIVESRLEKTAIFREKYNRNISNTKFTLPNVKEGSIIEFTYKINSEFLTRFPSWEFQRTIPTRHSEFWATIPDFFVFEKYMQGYLTTVEYDFAHTQAGQAKVHRWAMKNSPAFKVEPYMTCPDDFVSRINFAISHINVPGYFYKEIMGSWKKLNDDLVSSLSFVGAIKGSEFLQPTVDAIIAGKHESMEKIIAIHNYVKQNFEWSKVKDRYADNLKKVFEEKKGTAADINLLLASMLEKAGIEVDMVLLSTRDHGFIRMQYPMEQQFNYAVCIVRLADGNALLLDGTDPYLTVNILPEYCLNGRGMIVSETHHGWIELRTKSKAKTTTSGDFILAEDGSLTGKLTFQRDGYDAIHARKQFADKGEKQYVSDFVGANSWVLNKSTFQNVLTADGMMLENHDLVISDYGSSAGEIIYLNPFVVTQIPANPFKAQERSYPINFGSLKESIYAFKLTLPDGFTFDEIPKSKAFMLPDNAARYSYNVSQYGNYVSIASSFQINKSTFNPEEYSFLREFYDHVIAKQAEQIVIRKKISK